MIFSGCSPDAEDSHDAVEVIHAQPGTDQPLALLEGEEIIIDAGCVRVGDYAAFFPEGTSLSDDSTQLTLPDDRGSYDLDRHPPADFGGGAYDLGSQAGNPPKSLPLADNDIDALTRCGEELGIRKAWFVASVQHRQ